MGFQQWLVVALYNLKWLYFHHCNLCALLHYTHVNININQCFYSTYSIRIMCGVRHSRSICGRMCSDIRIRCRHAAWGLTWPRPTWCICWTMCSNIRVRRRHVSRPRPTWICVSETMENINDPLLGVIRKIVGSSQNSGYALIWSKEQEKLLGSKRKNWKVAKRDEKAEWKLVERSKGRKIEGSREQRIKC